MNADTLWSSILQAAIQGKLVSQDPNDEPASMLFDRIKEDLKVVTRKRKSQSALCRINDDWVEIIGSNKKILDDYRDLPSNWALVYLKDVCSDFLVPQRDKPKRFDGDIPWCRIEDIDGMYLNGSKTNQCVSMDTINQMNMKINPVGTVIYSISATIGVPAIVTVPCATNQTFIGIVAHSSIDRKYLYYYLESIGRSIKEKGNTTTITYVSREKVENIILTLPPLAEQKRIVAKLEELKPLVERYGKYQTRLSELNASIGPLLKKSILQAAIQGKLVPQKQDDEVVSLSGSSIYKVNSKWVENKNGVIKEVAIPFDVPDKWAVSKQKDVLTFCNGRAYSQDELLNKGKYRVIRVGNFFTNSSWYYSDLELEPEKYCECGDLLYAWSMSFGPKIWSEERAIYHYHIWKIKYSSLFDKEFLYYWLLADTDNIRSTKQGSTMQHVNMKMMNERLCYIPPLSEQKRIVVQLKSILTLVSKI